MASKRTKGMVTIGTTYEVGVCGPMDARGLVRDFDELLNPESWTIYVYNGMTVTVAGDEDESKNGVYILVDKDNMAEEGSWKKLASMKEVTDITDGEVTKETFEETIKALKSEDERLQGEIDDTNAKITQSESDLNEKIETVEKELTQKISESGSGLDSEIAEVKEELEGKITQSAETLTKQIETTESTLNETITSVKSELDERITETKNALGEDIDNLRTNFNEDLEQTRANLTDELESTKTQLKDEISDTKTELKSDIDEAKAQVEKDLDEAITNVKNSINEVDKNLTDNYYTKGDTDTQISNAVKESSDALKEAISDTETKIETEISDAKTELEGKITSVSNNLSENYYTKTETDGEIKTAVNEAKTDLEEQINKVKTDLDTDLDNTQQRLTDEIESVNSKLSTTIEETKTELKNTIEENKTEAKKDVEEAKAQVEEDLAKAQEQLQTAINEVGDNLSQNYYTKSNIDAQVTELKDEISAIPHYKTEVVDELPTEDISTSTVYLVRDMDADDGNLYSEYIYVNTETGEYRWELLGTQKIDLDPYATKEQVQEWLENYVTSSTLESTITTALGDYYTKTDIDTKVDSLEAQIALVEGGELGEQTVKEWISEAVEASEEKTEETISGIETRLDTAESGITGLQTDTTQLKTDVSDLQTTTTELTTTTENLTTRVSDIETRIEGLTGAMRFIGISTTDPTSADGPTIEGHEGDYESGDMCIYDNVEYVYDGTSWYALGESGDYLTKTEAAEEYLRQEDAQETYLTKTSAEENYVSKGTLDSYITKAEADDSYLGKDALDGYLKTETAEETYLTKADAQETYATTEYVDEKLKDITVDVDYQAGKGLTASTGTNSVKYDFDDDITFVLDGCCNDDEKVDGLDKVSTASKLIKALIYDGGVYLTEDVSMTTADLQNALTETECEEVTINTGDSTLTFTDNEMIVMNGVKSLTIEGKIEAETYPQNRAIFNMYDGESLYVKNLTANLSGMLAQPLSYSYVEIDGCDITTSGYYVLGTNSVGSDAHSEVVIKNSTLTMNSSDGDSAAILINNICDCTIENTTINGTRQGVIARAGNVTITDSTIDVEIKYGGGVSRCTSPLNWSSGNEVAYGALVCGTNSSTNGYKADAIVNVTNSTLKCTIAEGCGIDEKYAYALYAIGDLNPRTDGEDGNYKTEITFDNVTVEGNTFLGGTTEDDTIDCGDSSVTFTEK